MLELLAIVAYFVLTMLQIFAFIFWAIESSIKADDNQNNNSYWLHIAKVPIFMVSAFATGITGSMFIAFIVTL